MDGQTAKTLPEHRSQFVDSDGDGWGDNATLGAHKPDHWPNDASRSSAGSLDDMYSAFHRGGLGCKWLVYVHLYCFNHHELSLCGQR